jgi:4-diphosphocytidyl-2-C-methyl-D-erythritol kinase
MRDNAFAKLTLSLHITGVRADGYHELDALMVTVSAPHDVVTFEPGPGRRVVLEGPFVDGVPSDERNIALKAMEGCGATGKVHIEKNIPHGAGLGGGSADAAAVLRMLDADPAIGAALGADVPFCVRGGAARVRGIGEIIEPVAVPAGFVVIATPRFGCSTPAVYRAWDELGGPSHPTNDLEPAALHVEPRLVAFKKAIKEASGREPVLAGSGSSFFVLFDDEGAAAVAREHVEGAIDGFVWLGRFTGS